MSDSKDFLSRWSRRKLKPEAEKSAPEEKTPSPAGKKDVAAPSRPEPEFDITTLPSLESIGANSDVRAFLQRGVPVNLTRAALRRAWSADPAIRDFVGLSENSWDFNAPDSIPGFGSLDADQVRQVAARFFGELAETTEAPAAESNKGEETGSATEQIESEHQAEAPAERSVDQQQSDAAMQHRHQVAFCDSEPPPPKRHGRALPK